MNTSVQIIKDSIGPDNSRLTTFVLEYPRFFHADILTHRQFSRCSILSRAIRVENAKIDNFEETLSPNWWGKNTSARDQLNSEEIEQAKKIWFDAQKTAKEHADRLIGMGLQPTIANRLIEPWYKVRVILTGTEFENFFALRCHEDTQPEFKELVDEMLDVYNKSKPESLYDSSWHLPFSENISEEKIQSELIDNDWLCDFLEAKIHISMARCARISYLNFEGKDSYIEDIKLCDRIFGDYPPLMNPSEHVAVCTPGVQHGNLKGWKQYRYFMDNSLLEDKRVIKRNWGDIY